MSNLKKKEEEKKAHFMGCYNYLGDKIGLCPTAWEGGGCNCGFVCVKQCNNLPDTVTNIEGRHRNMCFDYVVCHVC